LNSKRTKEIFMKKTIYVYCVSISFAFVFIAACNAVNETVDLRIFSTATSLSTGENHTCAVLSGGTVSCWDINKRLF